MTRPAERLMEDRENSRHYPMQGAGFAGWGALGSPFYAELCDELAVDAEREWSRDAGDRTVW